MKDLVFQSAKKLARLIRTRKLSAVEVMKAHIAQIERVNPKVNAIVTFLPEAALKEARKLDAKLARKGGADGLGPLAGLPIAYKDMVATKGRAHFLGERAIGHVDPGAKTCQVAISAVCDQVLAAA